MNQELDMSPQAIDRRMRELAQLYRLGLEIRSARLLGRIEDLQPAQYPPRH